MATLQKRQPSRMTLSPKVAQAPPKIAASGKPVKRRTNSPFGGMNITEAKIRGQPRKVSQAEQKRASRYSNESNEKGKADGFRALKMQRALSELSYGHRSAVKQRIADVDRFADFDLLPAIQDSISSQALHGLVDVSPTPIQRLAVPALLATETKGRRRRSSVAGKQEMEQFLLAAETGSGKTLAYLLPVIDALKRAEAEEVERAAAEAAQREAQRASNAFEIDAPPLSNDPHPTTGRPRAIILVPTAELVSQVGALAKSLSHTIKFRAALISSAYSGPVIRSRLFSPSGIDLLISTPHLLSSITTSDPNVLSRVTHLVIDEADSLLDRSFAPTTSAILDRATPSLRQLILCSATIPRSLDSYLRKRFPDIRRLATPNLHAIPRRVQLAVVDVEKDPYKGNRNLACADTIYGIGREASEDVSDAADAVKRLVVFVNERERASEVAEYLRGKGVDAVALSRDVDERKQADILASFTGVGVRLPASPSSSKPNPAETAADRKPAEPLTPFSPSTSTGSKRQLRNAKVLVMTDLGSRGIDTLLVKHVILYDVPHTSIDFIHRLGRVGRMGRRGRESCWWARETGGTLSKRSGRACSRDKL
ncbi:RNA helicase [Taxawa tesnikishii (nom. ined.)]|nr:RNA helicase [Dothideales sp. JES 119]